MTQSKTVTPDREDLRCSDSSGGPERSYISRHGRRPCRPRSRRAGSRSQAPARGHTGAPRQRRPGALLASSPAVGLASGKDGSAADGSRVASVPAWLRPVSRVAGSSAAERAANGGRVRGPRHSTALEHSIKLIQATAGSRRSRLFPARGSAARSGSVGWHAPPRRLPASHTRVRSPRRGSSGRRLPSPNP